MTDGTFTMEDGEISENEASSGGGVYVGSSGTFTMEGGKISGNTAFDYGGGGVIILNEGIFTMTNGEISGNTANDEYGGGVYITGNGTFAMTNSKISLNTAFSSGGGVYAAGGGTFTMEGGEISGNTVTTTSSSGGGVYIAANGTFTLNGAARINSNNPVCLGSYNTVTHSAITIGGDFTGSGTVATIDLFAMASVLSWSGKAILTPAADYSGSLSAIKSHFTLGNFISGVTAPYTFTPITGYEIGDDGKLTAEAP
jgi:hypothetical protein